MLKFYIYMILLSSVLFSQSELSDRYTTPQEIEGRLNTWYEEFGNNVDPYPSYPGEEGIIYHHEIIGYSGVDNFPIWAIKLTMNANINEDKPKALILGQCHAEEIYGVEITLDLVDWLLHPIEHPTYYLSIYEIMENTEIWIVPTYNPEGLSVVHGWYDEINDWNQDVYYRKNKYDANNNNIFDFVVGIGNDYDGVDLNRNYDFNWIFGDDLNSTDSGCGANPSYIANYDYYRGPDPFSESEVVTIRDFVLEKNFLTSIAYHSSRSGCVSEKVIYPWEWDVDKKSPDFDAISRLGYEMSQLLPKEAESGYYASASSISRRGNAHDWIYANTGCFQYLVEVGTENMQPDDLTIIEATIEKNIIAALHLLKRTAGTSIQEGPEKHQITGIVTDDTGIPLDAIVYIDELDGPMLSNRYTDSFGRYRRLLVEGTYTIHFESFGYESQEYTFVPSSSNITEYNASMVPLDYHFISFDLILPQNFDETLNIQISSDNFQYTSENETSLMLNIPEGEYDILIYSDNIYPEKFALILDEDVNISKNIKWKSTVYHDEFLTLNNWNNQGWVLDDYNGILSSQSEFLYPNSLDLSLISLFQIDLGEYIAELNMKYELEWEYDAFSISSSANNEDVIIGSVTGHDYEWKKMLFNFLLGESSVLKLDFVSDESLDYRGVEIDYINIFKKPEEECDTADLNQDAVIDILDIILLVDRIIYGNISGFEQCLSDINNDGDINIIDIVAVINIIFANN